MVTYFALFISLTSIIVIGSHKVEPPDLIRGVELGVFLLSSLVAVVGVIIALYRWAFND